MGPMTVDDPLKDLAWALDDLNGRLPSMNLHRDYYEGRHRLVFATEKYRNTFGNLFREFADNLCDDVVDESVDRLTVLSWSGKDDAQTQAAQKAWETLRGDARLGALSRDSWAIGDGYLMVWPAADGMARWHVQRPEQMAVRYSTDDPDLLEVAVKVWREGKRYRATLYYPEGYIVRYASKGSSPGGGIPNVRAFQPFTETRPDGTVQEYLDRTEVDQMPVWHFPAGEVGAYGRSVLHDVIPLQDALNKSVSDLLVAMEKVALPNRWATGVEVPKDENGRDIDPFDEKKPVWWTASKEAAMGQFPQVDMTHFLKVQDSFRVEIARKGYLPLYSVPTQNAGTGGVPSGISLKVQEGRQVKRVQDWAADQAPALKAVMAATLTLNGTPTAPEDLEVEFLSPATVDEKTLLEGLQVKVNDLGVTKEQAQQEMGYDPDTIQEMADQRAENAPALGPLPPGGRANPMSATEAAMVDAAAASGE